MIITMIVLTFCDAFYMLNINNPYGLGVILLSLKNLPVFINTKLLSKSCYYVSILILVSPIIQLKHSYALVLVYDFLFGQGIECGGELKQFIFNHKAALQSCLARLKIRAKVHRNEDLLPKPAVETGN